MSEHDLEIEVKYICNHCVKEEFLSHEITVFGKRRKCSFCGKLRKTVFFHDIVDHIEKVMLSFYERTNDQPMSWQERLQNDKESNYSWEREGSTFIDILQNEFDIGEVAAKEISEILKEKYQDIDLAQIGEETEFDDDVQYGRKLISHEKWLQKWEEFKRILKFEARFFNNEAYNVLRSIFKDIERAKTFGGAPVVTAIGPGSNVVKLYRARVFQSEANLREALKKPELHLGPPPSFATTNGRMNAQGISVFYSSIDTETAIAEVRPPVGSKVATAGFNITRPLQLLDLRVLENVRESISVFSPEYEDLMGKSAFLSQLSIMITQPVMPGDEAQEYLPTQAIADYLASRTDMTFDGIIFPSVQVSGTSKTNIVLFNKSSRVESVQFPEGIEIEVFDKEYTDDEIYISYRVVEKVLKNQANSDHPSKESDIDLRAISLAIDLESINVHAIKAAKFETEKHPVSWERLDMQDYIIDNQKYNH